jgi:hypothetical protein
MTCRLCFRQDRTTQLVAPVVVLAPHARTGADRLIECIYCCRQGGCPHLAAAGLPPVVDVAIR